MNRKLPSITALKCFQSVARHLNMTYAARINHITQSAVSRQIKKLEEYIGQPLLRRQDSNSLQLTDAGRQFAIDVDSVLEHLDRAIENVSVEFLPLKRTPLRVVTEPTLAMKWLIPKMVEFNQLYPDIDVKLDTDFMSVLHDIDSCDLAILWGRGNWKGCQAELLRQETFVAVGAAEFFGSHAPVDHYGEVFKLPFLHHSHEISITQAWIDAACVTSKNVAAVPGSQYQHIGLLYEAVRSGCGVSILPLYLVQDELKKGTLKLMCTKCLLSEESYYVVYASERGNEVPLKNYLDWILTYREVRTDFSLDCINTFPPKAFSCHDQVKPI